MHFDQLLRVRSHAHEKEYPFCAPIDSNGLSLLDDDRIFIDDFEHLIRTYTPILHPFLTPAARRDSPNRQPAGGLVEFFISHLLLPQ
jgi:hypothetical protein